MDYCANTFRRELISRDGAQTISRQSHTLSTRDHGNDSNGEPPLKPGTNTYDQFNSNVLLRPVEYALRSAVVVVDEPGQVGNSFSASGPDCVLDGIEHQRCRHCRRGVPSEDSA